MEIHNHTFTRKLFGFDEAEVRDYLQQIATAMELLAHEKNNLSEITRDREIQVKEYKDKDAVLQHTIATATQMSDRIRQDAEREAKLIVQDAQQKAEMIVRDSRDSLKKMYQEIADLKRTRMQFEANLKALAQAHVALLEQGEKYMPHIGLPQLSMEEASK
jgi:cell division initiation protein